MLFSEKFWNFQGFLLFVQSIGNGVDGRIVISVQRHHLIDTPADIGAGIQMVGCVINDDHFSVIFYGGDFGDTGNLLLFVV